MKKLLLYVLCIAATHASTAQDHSWTANYDAGKIAPNKAVSRQSFPTNYKLFNLDANALKQQLFT
ncbi:MAG: hypothetical protein EOO92_14930, partial [Pedobacter sp.]